LKDKTHPHNFEVPPNLNTFFKPAAAAASPEEEELKETVEEKDQKFLQTLNEKIRQKLALLAGRVGMSFSQIAHPTFWGLIVECMNEMNKDLPPELQKDPLNVIQPPTRQQVSRITNEEGPKEKDNNLKRYAGAKATMSFDGSEFAHVPYYASVLYFPYLPNEPPCVVYFKTGVSSQAEMAEAAFKVLSEVWEYVDVTNVVLDGLFRQLQAFALFPSETSKEPNYQDKLPADHSKPLPFVLPDLPHVITLALTHVKEKPELGFGKYVDDANAICSEIRKKAAVAFIGSRCPTYSRTRFFHFVLEIMFIEKRKEKIIAYYQQFMECFFFCW
jgi:hypothetical protein